MAKQLITTVHVIERDEADNEVRRGVFGPGDTVPDWAVKAITNPYVWEGADTEDLAPGTGGQVQTSGDGAGAGEVPTGTVEEVLAWVREDDDQVQDRAQRALQAERAGKNRSTLVAELEDLAAGE